ncbi:hypothetical protein DFH06DRAFT_1322984 [Mycena polygramma]|nr:hypothetical protein DFH06DRAFT_1322984 [Mycena polygramma]
MGLVEEWLANTLFYAPTHIWMNNGDSDMSTPWEDDDFWIENRWNRGKLFERKEYGYWIGDLRAPTYVHPLGAALNTPPPTFRGFPSDERNTRTQGPTEQTSLGTNAIAAPAQTNQQPAAPLQDGSSTSGSDRRRDQGREEMLRYQALSSRERFHDEPLWGGRRPRYDPRNSRGPEYDDPEERARERDREERHRRDREKHEANNRAREERDRMHREIEEKRERIRRDQNREREAIRDRERERERERDRGNDGPIREGPYGRLPSWVARSDSSRENPREPPHKEPLCKEVKRRDDSPPRIFPSPNPLLAPRGSDGHPMAARTVARRASDYDGPQVTFTTNPAYAADEEDRVARHTIKTAKEKGKEPPQAVRARDTHLGPWQFLNIADIPQAINLIAWMEEGEDTAYAKFKFIVQNASALPGEFRAEGETYLLSQQQRLEQQWWRTTRGETRPNRAERVSNARGGGTSTSRAPAPGLSVGRTPNAGFRPPHDEDVNMEEDAPPAWSFGSSTRITPTVQETMAPAPSAPPLTMGGFLPGAVGYLGSAPPNPLDLAPPAVAEGEFRVWRGLPNTLGTVVEVSRHYAFADPSTWTAGIRNALGNRPARGGDDVHIGDALAFQTCVALGPADRRNRAHQWRRFYETSTLMLSIPGFFAFLVEAGGYPAGSLEAEHFAGPTDNVTMPVIAAWYVRHGIPTTGPVIEALEAFGRSRRNMRVNIPDLMNVGWPDEPQSVRMAMAVNPASIPTWAMLCSPTVTPPPAPVHAAPVVARVATGNTVDGLASSIHAPAMELDDNAPSSAISSTSGVRIINDPLAPEDLLASPSQDSPPETATPGGTTP